MDRDEGPLSNCLPVTRGVRTRLLTVLADAYPNLLITNVIQQRLRIKFGCNHRYRRDTDDSQYIPEWLPPDCTFGDSCAGQCWYGQAYPQLRKLAEFGLVEWRRSPAGGGSAAWRLADPDTGDTATHPPDEPHRVDLDSVPPRRPL